MSSKSKGVKGKVPVIPKTGGGRETAGKVPMTPKDSTGGKKTQKKGN